MTLQPGSRIGAHEILTLLGSGGMGEVYRARDERLNRDVAIKVLPGHLASDPDRLARLRREAQVLAGLNNPHIAHIHGLEDANGVFALVLELVEGCTLEERIAIGFLPSDAIDVGRQIADGLEAAHENGVIHRDLKPANVKITPDGTVKLLDFGLAKAVSGDRPEPDLSMVTTANTEAGVVLGTAAYMSPEQARGRPVDKRTDIWAFGCVLFEMLSGRRPFVGDTLSDTIAGILTRDPDWSALPVDLPASISVLLRRCLEKDSRRRLRDIGDARIELDDAKGAPPGHIPREQPATVTRRTAIGALTGAIAGSAATGLFAISRYRGATPRRLTTFAIADLAADEQFVSSHGRRIAVSPDGAHLTYVAANATQLNRLYLRSLGALSSKLLLESGAQPFFSSDSRWIASVDVVGEQLRKVAITGGAPVTVCRGFGGGGGGGTWADGDVLYFVGTNPGGLLRVAAAGGQADEAAKFDFAGGERLYKFPSALPGGKAILFTLATADSESFDDAHIAVFVPETGKKRILVDGGTHPRYSPTGHIVYARNGQLLAVRFDLSRLEVSGEPFTVLEGVLMSRNSGVANFDIAATGDLAYIPGKAEGGARTLVWVDRGGQAEKVSLPPRSYLHPRISPDGRRVAVEVEGSHHDIFVYDITSGVLSNITTDGVSHWPVWSPDGRDVGYRSGPMGRFQLWQVRADRSRPPELVRAAGVSQSAESYSPDGQTIAYTAAAPGVPPKVTIVPLQGDGTPRPLDNSRYAQGSPKFSPDGRWLAYCSNESGKPQVYVQAFPGPGSKIQVSSDGGTDPVWKRAGDELFYRNGDSMLAVPISPGPSLTNGRPHELWKGHYSHGMSSSCGPAGLTSSNYDVTPDGERFLMIKDDDQDSATSKQVVVVLGWADELTRLSRA